MYDVDFEDYDIEENEDEDQGTVLVADIDWAPNNEKLDWSDPNFTKDIISRLKGITEEGFAAEVEMWQRHINSLPPYDEFEIRKEIRGWNLDIPTKDNFNIESFAQSYALQVQYRNRLTEIISLVYAHFEILSQAYKCLKEMALKLSSGTAKDKDATAGFTVHPFVAPMTHAKRLNVYLESVLKNIDFSSSQMDRIIREHQALSRINQTVNNIGMAQTYEDSVNKFQNKYKSGGDIPGRRMI
jgi:hypothetical protein